MTTALVERREMTAEQIELVKRTICKDATNDELTLFIGQCNRTGLDPFSRQIHAVKRWDSAAGRQVMSIQVGVDGFRLVAQRTGEADGQDGPYWCGADGKWSDVWLSTEPPAAAKVVVYRKGESHPYTGVARLAAYVQTKKDGSPNQFWARMADVMLAKCAECLALRKAFPQELSGLYSAEEMRDLPEQEAEVVPPQPRPAIASPVAADPDRGDAWEPPASTTATPEQVRTDRVLAALHSVKASWIDPKVRQRLSVLIGREIPANAHVSTLNETEATKIVAYCDEKAAERAAAKAAKAQAPAPGTTSPPVHESAVKAICARMEVVGMTWPKLRGHFPELLGVQPDDVARIQDLTVNEGEIILRWLEAKPAKQKAGAV